MLRIFALSLLTHFPLFPPYRDHYFSSASWVSATEIAVVWLNRPQNISVVSICRSPQFACIEVSRIGLIKRVLWLPLFPSASLALFRIPTRRIVWAAMDAVGWTPSRCHCLRPMRVTMWPFPLCEMAHLVSEPYVNLGFVSRPTTPAPCSHFYASILLNRQAISGTSCTWTSTIIACCRSRTAPTRWIDCCTGTSSIIGCKSRIF